VEMSMRQRDLDERLEEMADEVPDVPDLSM